MDRLSDVADISFRKHGDVANYRARTVYQRAYCKSRKTLLYQPALTLTLLMSSPSTPSSSSGSTRGSAGAGIAFGAESRGVAARDARVEPEHHVITHVSLSSPFGITRPPEHQPPAFVRCMRCFRSAIRSSRFFGNPRARAMSKASRPASSAIVGSAPASSNKSSVFNRLRRAA
jgi:hypothetical protein